MRVPRSKPTLCTVVQYTYVLPLKVPSFPPTLPLFYELRPLFMTGSIKSYFQRVRVSWYTVWQCGDLAVSPQSLLCRNGSNNSRGLKSSSSNSNNVGCGAQPYLAETSTFLQGSTMQKGDFWIYNKSDYIQIGVHSCIQVGWGSSIHPSRLFLLLFSLFLWHFCPTEGSLPLPVSPLLPAAFTSPCSVVGGR